MKKPPIQAREKSPPYHPTLSLVDDGQDREIAFDQNGRMWVKPVRRIRWYVCYQNVWHRTYWRTHWQQGRQDWVACEHEVN